MIRGIGIDLVEIARMKAAYGRHEGRLVGRVCTPAEAESVGRDRQPALKLAAIFGIKEAVMKALGTGMRGVRWREIDTSGAEEGTVERLLAGGALAVARRIGAARYCFSVTVSGDVALAAVLLSGPE